MQRLFDRPRAHAPKVSKTLGLHPYELVAIGMAVSALLFLRLHGMHYGWNTVQYTFPPLVRALPRLFVVGIGLPSWGAVDLLVAPRGVDGLASAAALIFFAYLGFDELGNLVEEMHDPARTLPRALGLAMAGATLIYVLVALAAGTAYTANAIDERPPCAPSASPQEPVPASNTAGKPARTLALLVGIDDYQQPAARSRQLGPLLGAQHDIVRVRELLLDRFGFEKDSIVELLGSAATHEAIVRKFHEHLIPGASFVFEGGDARHAQIFFSLYFVMTGLHALHMVIGIAILAVLVWQAARGAYGSHYYSPVELTGLYWHFVDIIWIFLFPLLYLIGRH